MNKKLIAAAVSAAVMAPVAAQADVSVYGRVHNGIQFRDVDGGESTTDVYSVVSRFGIKASSDLGNGLTASARYEFGVNTDRELTGAGNLGDVRIGTVGISGGFGSITIGNQWSAFYDIVGTHIDPTFTIAYNLYSSFTGGPYRASNTIKYSNSFGPVYLELDVRLNDSEEGSDVAENRLRGDGVGVGVSIAATDNFTIALAVDSEDGVAGADDTDRSGVAVKWASGGFWASLGTHENEVGSASTDHTQFWIGTSFSDSTSAMIGVGSADNGATEPSAVSVGVYHNVGGGFKLMYEGTSYDTDTATGDFTRHVFSMRLDF